MSNQFKPSTLVGAIAVAMGLSSPAFANTNSASNQDILQLETLVVTASRSEERVEDVPARMTVITQKQIDQNPIQNLSALIQKDPSIYIKQNGGMGQGSAISLRGSYPGNTLILKDGARLNTLNSLSPTYPETLDLSDAQQVEIVKGPSSVQYGSDAIGGVIQIISATPTKNAAFVTGQYGENNTYKAIVGGDLVSNGFYAQVRGQRLESDGTSIFNTQAKNDKAGYDQKGYSAKIGYADDVFKTSLAISDNQGTNVYSSDYKTNNAQRDFKNQLINWLGQYNVNSDISLNARYSNFKDEQNYKEAFPSFANTTINEGDLNAKWNFTSTQNILAGVTFNNTEYETSSLKDKKQEIDSTGYYVQHQYKTDGINTQAGIRLEDNEKFGTHVVGQLAGRVQIAPLTSIYANIGSAFKTPAGDQLFDTAWNKGNPDLKPEESISYEIGIDQELNYGLSVYSSLYYTQLKNLIQFQNQTYNNVDKADLKGAELGFKWKQDDLFLSTEYAYAKTKNKQNKLEIAYRPRQTLTLTTGLENQVYGISASLIARSTANASNTVNPVKVPGYATIDLNAYWNVSPNLKLFTNIQNVGDVRYEEVYNNYPSEMWYINGGRLASVGFTVKY